LFIQILILFKKKKKKNHDSKDVAEDRDKICHFVYVKVTTDVPL
jgi:hypothetical protein